MNTRRSRRSRKVAQGMSIESMLAVVAAVLLVAVCNDEIDAAELASIPGIALSEARVESSVDGNVQPIVVGVPQSYAEGTATPLLVGLHTWSSHYLQMVNEYGGQAAKRDWLVVCPHFRGPNLTTNPKATEAGGSVLAQHDIIDAIEYMKANFAVDDRRIYIIGGSGGGHMTSLMCTKYPDVFAAGVAWCPITDFRSWQAQQNGYAKHVEAVCGGKPGDSPDVDFEYTRRSPRTFITNAANCNLLIGHGDKDAVIWPEQTWETFRGLKHLPAHRVLFESWSAGHAGKTTEGLDWATDFVRNETPPSRLDIVTDEAKSYFWLHVAPAGPLTLGKCTAILTREEGEPTALSLHCEDAGEVRVSLQDLGLAAPTDLPDGATVADGTLTVRPADGKGEYTIAF